jgi:4-amino-4-deoxy-L-arabinose transferase-like glycosyltransferase
MSEDSVQKTKSVQKFFLIVIIGALLLPHTFQISSQSFPDASFERYSLITVLLTVFYEYGSTLVGPYSNFFLKPPTSEALLNILTLVLNVLIIIGLIGFARRAISRKRVLQLIGLVLCVHVFLLFGVFSYQLDAVASVLAIPLPVFPIIGALVVIRNKVPSLQTRK